MVVDLDAVPTLSSRDKLLGKRVVGIEETNVVSGFSNRIQQILFKEMVKTVVLTLMGRSIGVVMAWVRLSRLLSILYKKKILEEIGGMIGKVLVNEAIQQVELESLMTIYFSCGRYGHVKEMCPKPVVENKSWSGPRESRNQRVKSLGKEVSGSRFTALVNLDALDGKNDEVDVGFLVGLVTGVSLVRHVGLDAPVEFLDAREVGLDLSDAGPSAKALSKRPI
ncbi:hypothetical protein Goshw_028350 [Gossypium schwendimanii]|uniref:CCHC-type domain-containing protein n=1 Tax=Gossypium schwendimanii TaxID=34291 RepID=A0A7J9L649_GOSSC|nr:hypothetical protein [Gossypium schwendimanii]